VPLVVTSSPPGSLLLSKKDAALGSTRRRCFRRDCICGSHAIEMMNVLAKDGAAEKRLEHLRQQQVRNRSQLVTAGGVASDVHSQRAQLLHQPPNLRSVSSNLLGKFSAANNNCGKAHQHTNNAAETNVGLKRRVMLAASLVLAAPLANWWRAFYAGIIGQSGGKHKPVCGMQTIAS